MRFAHVKCVDVSEGGMRVEGPVPVPLRANILLRAERIHLSGSAVVKHVARYGAKYILGLEMSHALQEKTLAAIQQAPPSSAPPVL